VTPLLAGLAVLLAFAGAWELAGVAEGRLALQLRGVLVGLGDDRQRSLDALALRLGLSRRLARAGLDSRIDAGALLAAKFGCAVLGGLVAVLAAPAVPARLGVAVVGMLVGAGFFSPDALLERLARRRRGRFLAALPDALDVLAVGAASGRSPTTGFAEIARGTGGPLAVELGAAVAEIECGAPIGRALERLRERVSGAEVGALAAAIERSRLYGSPLAEQLHLQATSLRREARREVENRAARAAPKIQLVVALVLVPSVLLMIAAGLIANADVLLAGF
jgi:tight adherence protein C